MPETYFAAVTHTFVLNEDEPDPARQNSVTIKKFSTKARQEVNSLATKARADASGEHIDVDAALLRLLMVYRCTVSWTGPMFGGEPVTDANIDRLDPAIFDRIAGACDDLNAGLTSAEKNGLSSRLNGSS